MLFQHLLVSFMFYFAPPAKYGCYLSVTTTVLPLTVPQCLQLSCKCSAVLAVGVGVARLAVFVQSRPSPSSAVPPLAFCGLWRYRKDQVQSTSLEICASPKEGGTAELNELTGISGRCRILCFVTEAFHFERVLKFQIFFSCCCIGLILIAL